MNYKYLINIGLVLFNFMFGHAQIVNEGVLYISDSTNVYFENELINKKGSIINNNGTLFFNKGLKNEGLVDSSSGHTYFKCEIQKINVAGTDNTIDLFSLSTPFNNRVTYLGQKTKAFQINAVYPEIENEETMPANYFLMNKNSSEIIKTSRLRNSITGKVEFSTNDFIEIWEQKILNDSVLALDILSLNFISD